MADVVIEEICPSIEELSKVLTEIPCHVKGCSKILFNTAALRMHVIKTHNIVEDDKEKAVFTRSVPSPGKKCKLTKKIFYCPVAGCSRSKTSNKPFPRLGQVKQHYMTVHAEKKYTCSKCARGFGIEAACKRHEVRCGLMFNCTCGCPFTTREALLMHARRRKHELPAMESADKCKSKRKGSTSNATVPKPTVIIISTNDLQHLSNKTPAPAGKYCNILPKPASPPKIDSTTSTYRSTLSSSKKDAITQTSECTWQESGIQAVSTQTVYAAQSCLGGHVFGNVNQSSVSTQFNASATMMDFEGQVMLSGICEQVPHSSVGTQYDGNVYMGFNNPSCFDSQSPFTLSTNPFFSSSETQTQGYGHISLEDNAVQTQLSSFTMLTAPYLNSSETQTQDCGHISVENNAAQTQTSVTMSTSQYHNSSETQTSMIDSSETQDFRHISLEDNSVQTPASFTVSTSAYLHSSETQTSIIDSSETQTHDFRQICLEDSSAQTQTSFSSAYHNSSETQTQAFDDVAHEDNAAQTLISILDMDPSCSAECGTQTHRIFDEILSQDDVELTESQTQTWLSSLMPSDPILNMDNDFDLVNIQTQTVIDDIPFDCGLINTETQTIPESFGGNCWDYEPNNRQTQMTQTGGVFYPFDSNNSSLMDTYTQTFLGDTVTSSISNVQTQT